MNAEQFVRCLENPELIRKEQLDELNDIISEYPWCQPAQLLYLKCLHFTGGVQFSKQLRVTTAYAGSRMLLFTLLNLTPSANAQDEQVFEESGTGEPDLLEFDFDVAVRKPEPPAAPIRKPQADLIDRFIEAGGSRIIRPDQIPGTQEDV